MVGMVGIVGMVVYLLEEQLLEGVPSMVSMVLGLGFGFGLGLEAARARHALARARGVDPPTSPHISPLHLPYISPTSRLHLPYISPTSPLHLPSGLGLGLDGERAKRRARPG